MDTLKTYALFGLAALCVVLGLSTCAYRTQFKATSHALDVQNKAIEAQKAQAAQELAAARAEVAAKQKQLDERASAQEKTDAQATNAIAADSRRDAAEPTRVRYITRYARGCDPRAGGGATPDAGAGAAAAGEANGVLAPKAEELARRDRDAVEALQAAFNSCKATWTK